MFRSLLNSTSEMSLSRSVRSREFQRPGIYTIGPCTGSASYAITGPAHFTNSEVAADWLELMVLQRSVRPSVILP